MHRDNPYAPPAAEVATAATHRPFTALTWTIFALITIQLIAFALYSPALWRQVRYAMISGTDFLQIVLAALLLAIGAGLLFVKSRGAIYVLGSAALFWIGSLFSLQSVLQFTGVFISVGATIASRMQLRR